MGTDCVRRNWTIANARDAENTEPGKERWLGFIIILVFLLIGFPRGLLVSLFKKVNKAKNRGRPAVESKKGTICGSGDPQHPGRENLDVQHLRSGILSGSFTRRFTPGYTVQQLCCWGRLQQSVWRHAEQGCRLQPCIYELSTVASRHTGYSSWKLKLRKQDGILFYRNYNVTFKVRYTREE